MGKKTAIISGISGQDGSYLAELLLAKGYKVYGLIRQISPGSLWRINHILDKVTLIQGDLLDQSSLDKAIQVSQPTECYHLGAQSFVKYSFDAPEYTLNVTGLGTLRLLEAIKQHKKDCKFYFAASSEQFGRIVETPQTEKTVFNPQSPYGIAKVMGFNICTNYRESYNMHISCGIAFNHESIRRGEEFVTRKITKGVAEIKTGKRAFITLGNLDTARDWGYAGDFVKAFWLMLQQDKPDDYIIATSRLLTLKYLLEVAFKCIGIDDFMPYIKQDPKFMRPADVVTLTGDASKIMRLGWSPEVSFESMIKEMVEKEV